MKILKSLLLASTPAILAVGLLLLPVTARADAKGGGTRQVSLSRSQAATVAVSSQSTTTPVAMTCAKCTDSKTVVAEHTFKATQPIVKHVVSTHGCEDCATKMVSAGHGKSATMKVAHTCTMEPKGCCAIE